MVRDLARQLGKRARLTIVGEGLEVDRDVLDRLDATLTHLLRNALDHGIESAAARRQAGKPEDGQLRIWATHRAGMLAIDISDDGNGIDLESVRRRLIDSGRLSPQAAATLTEQALKEHLFSAGFSTRTEVTEVSGRGVGLDVVRESIERLDGSVRLTTRAGIGTTFHLLVPISRAVTRALAVRTGGEVYAFPSLRIHRVLRVAHAEVESRDGMQYLPQAGRNIGLVPLAELLDLGSTRLVPERVDIVVIEHQGRLAGFVVEELLGEYDLATRPLDTRLGRVADVAAIAMLPDETAVVLLDVDDLMRSALARERAGMRTLEEKPGTSVRRKRVLVADDSISVRELERQLLAGQGFDVEVAVDGVDAWTRLRDENFDLLVTDVDMPRMDGIELTRSIKQDPRLRSLPVVIVSYRDRAEDRRRGLEARADSYLTKSDFQDESFIKLIHQLLGPANA
jgi:two-component system sensor histidine kinase and response regulator WspE